MTKRSRGQTDMGGGNRRFEPTRWTTIEQIKASSEEVRRILTGELLASYWKPVYCYLRKKGFDSERAKDLTQGFFQRIVLERRLIERADRTKGRFRSFLLTSLDNYSRNVHESDNTRRRRPEGSIASLDVFDEGQAALPSCEMTPEETFAYAWASTLLDEVLGEVREGCEREGKGAHWVLFRARVLEPIMEGGKLEPLPSLCGRRGGASEEKASNMIVTVKRRFRAAIKRRIAEYSGSESEFRREIGDLMEILAKGGAR